METKIKMETIGITPISKLPIDKNLDEAYYEYIRLIDVRKCPYVDCDISYKVDYHTHELVDNRSKLMAEQLRGTGGSRNKIDSHRVKWFHCGTQCIQCKRNDFRISKLVGAKTKRTEMKDFLRFKKLYM